MNNWYYINNNLHQLLDEIKMHLTRKDYQDISELLDNNEQGLALEILCDLIDEHHIYLSPYMFEIIKKTGKGMGIDKKYWKNLKITDSQ